MLRGGLCHPPAVLTAAVFDPRACNASTVTRHFRTISVTFGGMHLGGIVTPSSAPDSKMLKDCVFDGEHVGG